MSDNSKLNLILEIVIPIAILIIVFFIMMIVFDIIDLDIILKKSNFDKGMNYAFPGRNLSF